MAVKSPCLQRGTKFILSDGQARRQVTRLNCRRITAGTAPRSLETTVEQIELTTMGLEWRDARLCLELSMLQQRLPIAEDGQTILANFFKPGKTTICKNFPSAHYENTIVRSGIDGSRFIRMRRRLDR